MCFCAVVSEEEQSSHQVTVLPCGMLTLLLWTAAPPRRAGAHPGGPGWLVGFTAGQSVAEWSDVLIDGRGFNCHLISPCVVKVCKQLCCMRHMGARPRGYKETNLYVLQTVFFFCCHEKKADSCVA